MGAWRLVLVTVMCWGTLEGSSDPCPLKPSATCRYVRGSCLCVLDSGEWTGIFRTAVDGCANMLAADVASIRDEKENMVLMDLIANNSNAVWLGIKRGDGGSYRWIDGTPVDYFNVLNGTQEGSDSCHIMKPGDSRWWPQSCYDSYGVACTYPYVIPTTQTSETTEMTSSPVHQTTTVYAPCAAECQVVNVSCLCVLMGPGNYLMMDKMCAVRFEFGFGGVPASIMTQEENDILMGMIKEVPRGVWIGLGWDGNSYVWNGLNEANYLNLGNSSTSGDSYMMSSSDGKWYPANGMKGNFGAACKYKPDPPITPPPSTTPASTLGPTPSVPQGGPNITIILAAVAGVLVVIGTTTVLVVFLVRRRRRNRLEDYANLTSHVDI